MRYLPCLTAIVLIVLLTVAVLMKQTVDIQNRALQTEIADTVRLSLQPGYIVYDSAEALIPVKFSRKYMTGGQ